MEKKNKEKDTWETIVGCFCTILLFSSYLGLSMLMFWLCVKCTGNNMEDIFR